MLKRPTRFEVAGAVCVQSGIMPRPIRFEAAGRRLQQQQQQHFPGCRARLLFLCAALIASFLLWRPAWPVSSSRRISSSGAQPVRTDWLVEEGSTARIPPPNGISSGTGGRDQPDQHDRRVVALPGHPGFSDSSFLTTSTEAWSMWNRKEVIRGSPGKKCRWVNFRAANRVQPMCVHDVADFVSDEIARSGLWPDCQVLKSLWPASPRQDASLSLHWLTVVPARQCRRMGVNCSSTQRRGSSTTVAQICPIAEATEGLGSYRYLWCL